jgi:ABC-2 type transport system permease protein
VATIHIFADWNWLKYIDFFGVSNDVSLGKLTISQFGPYLLTCAIILVVCIGVSLLTIREKEL